VERFPIMQNHQHRFYCHIEADGNWGVWDRTANGPAKLGGGDLSHCTSQRAHAAESVLTRIYDNGLDASAMRLAGIAKLRTNVLPFAWSPRSALLRRRGTSTRSF